MHLYFNARPDAQQKQKITAHPTAILSSQLQKQCQAKLSNPAQNPTIYYLRNSSKGQSQKKERLQNAGRRNTSYSTSRPIVQFSLATPERVRINFPTEVGIPTESSKTTFRSQKRVTNIRALKHYLQFGVEYGKQMMPRVELVVKKDEVRLPSKQVEITGRKAIRGRVTQFVVTEVQKMAKGKRFSLLEAGGSQFKLSTN